MSEAQRNMEQMVKDHARLLDEIARLREENAMLLEQHKSACIAVRKLAPEVTRLREAICAWAELEYMDKAHDPDRWERYLRAGTRLVEIAREGR